MMNRPRVRIRQSRKTPELHQTHFACGDSPPGLLMEAAVSAAGGHGYFMVDPVQGNPG